MSVPVTTPTVPQDGGQQGLHRLPVIATAKRIWSKMSPINARQALWDSKFWSFWNKCSPETQDKYLTLVSAIFGVTFILCKWAIILCYDQLWCQIICMPLTGIMILSLCYCMEFPHHVNITTPCMAELSCSF